MADNNSGWRFDRPGEIPQLRKSPEAGDGFDAQRCAYNKHLWHSLDNLLRPRDRQIEENVRMLHGQHWIAWSELKGRFVNLLDQMPDDEKQWRHMPVLNRLFMWFVLVHARMNENPPVIGWQPGPDRIDAQLAEVCDPIFKYLWRETQMLEVLDRLFAWMIPSGRAHLKSRIDPMKGDPIPQTGPAMLQLLGPDGRPIQRDGQPIERVLDGVPYAPGKGGDYQPAVRMIAGEGYEDDENDYQLQPAPGLKPEMLYEGGIEVDVLTALEVRGAWGHAIPWHKKQWHMHRVLLTPLEAFEAFGVEIEPDVRGQEAESSAAMWRLLQGGGLFGSADAKRGDPGSEQEFCTIYESWHRPGRLAGTERTAESAGGRLLITTGGGKVIRDGVRPAPFRYTSPIRTFDFVALPGRPSGSTPQEYMNGPVRTRNRLTAQILGHATLAANPIRVVDRSTGLEEGQVPNIPGAEVLVDRSKSKAMPIEYVNVPNMGRDVYEASDRMKDETDQMGQISGSEATAPTDDASARLVQELRYNSDRPVSSTMKRTVIELGRLAEDWLALAPIIWDQQKIISIVGEDSIARVIEIYPELFRDGMVNVEPEIESMLPESRQERQKRAREFFDMGVWGDARTPQAVMGFLDHARFPHMSRLTRPGGADRATAEQNVGQLLQGAPASAIPVYPWYDIPLHKWVLEQYMKSPEYKKRPIAMQQEMVAFWKKLLDAEAEAMLLLSQREARIQTGAAAARLAGEVALQPLASAAQPTAPDAGGPTPPPSGSTGKRSPTSATAAA